MPMGPELSGDDERLSRLSPFRLAATHALSRHPSTVMRALSLIAASSLALAVLGCNGCASSSSSSTAATAATDAGAPTGTPSTDPGTPAANPATDIAYPDPSATCAAGLDTSGFWGLSAKGLGDTRDAKLCQYAGKVVLVVNVASSCGYTPQYEGLQATYAKYAAQGFTILAFPCNQFGSQESGDATQIRDFCSSTYKVTFPLFEKVDVNGSNTHPVYTWLKAQPGASADIGWNFTKFLIGRDGKLAKRWASQIEPENAAVTSEIEAALAVKP
jgi:glutathione peroxidase